MEYREIKRTGMKAGVVGLGCEHLDKKPFEVVQETLDAAIDSGVNMIDLFMPGAEVRQNIGRALAGKRDKVMIQGHICSTDQDKQFDICRDAAVYRRYFEDLLRHLGTDYIDFGMLFFIDSEADYKAVFDGGVLSYAKTLKQRGIIRAIGASSHNPVTAARVVESGEIDLLMFSINPAFDMVPGEKSVLDELDGNFSKTALAGPDPIRARLYRLCEQKDVAITVMKTLGAGRLLTAQHSPFGQPLSVAQCIHYALTRPAVVSAMVGCIGAAEVREAAGYLNTSGKERDYSEVISRFAEKSSPACMYCNHCQPCPSGIDIAALTKYLDIALLDAGNIPPGVALHYRSLGAKGADCIGCGSCEKRCPFGVGIMENMRKAAALFGQ